MSLSVLSVTQLLFLEYDICFLFISRPSTSLNTLAISEYVREHQQKDSEIVVQTNSAINRIAEALTLYRNGALFYYRYARKYPFLYRHLPFVDSTFCRTNSAHATTLCSFITFRHETQQTIKSETRSMCNILRRSRERFD